MSPTESKANSLCVQSCVNYLQNQMYPGSSELTQCSSHPVTQTVSEKKLQQVENKTTVITNVVTYKCSLDEPQIL